jgi:hypothetical protein
MSDVCVTIDGVWIGNWICWTLTELTTNNYSVIANSHILQFTTARTKSSQCAVFLPLDAPLLPWSRPRRLAASSHQPPTLLTAVSRLSSKVKVTLRLTASQSVSLGVKAHLGLMTRYLLLFDSSGLVFVAVL